jgi:hypothetical protein
MRKVTAWSLALTALIFLLTACQAPQKDGTPTTDTPAATTADGTPLPTASGDMTKPTESGSSAYPAAEKSDPEFSFVIGQTTLTLRENNLSDKLKALPLKLESDNTEILGQGSDTFQGSAVRTVTYGGLVLKLMAPKDAPDNFWVLQMTATDPSVVTPRGVTVGDTLEKLLEKYPEAAAPEWDKNAYRFQPGVDTLDELVFAVTDGVVTKITATYNLP